MQEGRSKHCNPAYAAVRLTEKLSSQVVGMRTLVYKMTHIGDPCEGTGVWGDRTCMGRVRGYEYDAVIGVGGTSAHDGIARRLVWIGIGPRIEGDRREPRVMFEHFLYKGKEGPVLKDKAPDLARHMYVGGARLLLNASETERREIENLLRMARTGRASPALSRRLHPRLQIQGCPHACR
jgi:hypothetical protein